MNEMIKRRKDEGFTLIELMIVIAVIGILAIVLVPKVGSIKTQAKGAGIDTNMRVVEGYVQSKINPWVSKDLTKAQVADDINKTFSATNNVLTNPFTSETDGTTATENIADAVAANHKAVFVLKTADGVDSTTVSAAATRGTIVVSITGTSPITNVKLFAHGDDGALLDEKTVTITP